MGTRDSPSIRLFHIRAGSHGEVAFGYELAADHLAGQLLPEIVEAVGLRGEVTARLHDPGARAASRSQPLGAASLGQILPGYEVAVYGADGRSLDEVVARQRWSRRALVSGVLITFMIGLVFTARAAGIRAADQ